MVFLIVANMTLHELNNGDVFVHEKAKKPARFVVYGNPQFNARHGSATRNCKDNKGRTVSKSCRLAVVKVGVSVHADKIKEMFK